MQEPSTLFTAVQHALAEKHVMHGLELFLTPGYAHPGEMRCTECDKHLFAVNAKQIAYWCEVGGTPILHTNTATLQAQH
jgi:hypothetical protein